MIEPIKKSDIRVVTVCDQPPVADYYCYHEFHRSLERQGVYALELGSKEGEYLGLASKPKLLLKAIQEGWIKEKYIIFCDCYDLVFCSIFYLLFFINRSLFFCYLGCTLWLWLRASSLNASQFLIISYWKHNTSIRIVKPFLIIHGPTHKVIFWAYNTNLIPF